MTEEAGNGEPGREAPLFLLSFRHRDELAVLASRNGWQAIAARRPDNAEQRFLASGAMIAVVDLRGAFDEGLAAISALADAVEVTATALLALVSRSDVSQLDMVVAAGATHYLAAPFSEEEFLQNLRLAERHAVRLAGGWNAVERRRAVEREGVLAWQADVRTRKAVVSEALRKRLGLDTRDADSSVLLSRIERTERDGARTAVRRVLDSGRPAAFVHTVSEGRGGRARVIQHLRFDAVRQMLFGTIEFADPELEVRGGRDPLTGLRDAASARRWIEARLLVGEAHFHVLLLSITRFEMINTAFGRETGDELLQTVARLVAPLVADLAGRRALVARTTGAEFIIGLPEDVDAERALLLAQNLVDLIERPLLCGTHLITLSTRIAIAENLSTDADAFQMLRRASATLADAKMTEQGRIRMVTSAGQSEAAFDEMLQSDLRNALDRDEIELLFQPQVAVTTGKIVGVEALARWRHPRHGELGAATLFAVAEQSDYLLALSAHVQQRALAQAAAWPTTLAGLRLSVNITAEDIARPGFAAAFLDMVDASGFPRSRLTVEVTETGLIADLSAASTLLAELRAGGCRVAIDDFGTGYSSLAYLKALPLDYLKIDKKLAEDITGSTRDRIVVRGVIDMARSLGLAVIAEGVETEEQLSLLAREGCNYYQGFLCAAPLDVAALVALVTG
jgi:diguanylate cyclase (GGDEF)-like protein